MPVRTTVEIPDALHNLLRRRAAQSGTSIRSLIVQAVEQPFPEPKKSPILKGRGKLGPNFPVDENPHDLVFS